ncbi:MAG: ester cyclase [Ilumatobacteraceae bacterium]
MDNNRATAVMEAMVAMFASGDPSEASASVDEAYLDHQGLGAGPLHGVDGFAFVVRANFASYRHLEVRIEDLFASGDRVAARITWVGRRSNGEHTTRETIDILRVSGGRAIEHWGAAVCGLFAHPALDHPLLLLRAGSRRGMAGTWVLGQHGPDGKCACWSRRRLVRIV